MFYFLSVLADMLHASMWHIRINIIYLYPRNWGCEVGWSDFKNKKSYTFKVVPNCDRIGWSDFVFFSNFKIYTILLIRSSIPKIGNFGQACVTHASILSFPENHWALIHYYLFGENLQKPSYTSKNNCQI